MENLSNDYYSKSILFLEVYYSSGSRRFQNLNYQMFDWTVSKDIKTIYFHYFTSTSYGKNPFDLNINYANSSSPGSNTGTIIIVIFLLVTILVFTIIFYKCRKQLPNRPESLPININNIINLPESQHEVRRKNNEVLMKLLQSKLKPVKFTQSLNKFNNICTICLEDYNLSSEVTVLECGHIFHHTCLKDWLIKNILSPKCPNCNENVLFNHHFIVNANVQSSNVQNRNIENVFNLNNLGGGPGLEISHLNIAQQTSNNAPPIYGRIDININNMYNHPQTVSVEQRNAGQPVNNNYVNSNNQVSNENTGPAQILNIHQ